MIFIWNIYVYIIRIIFYINIHMLYCIVSFMQSTWISTSSIIPKGACQLLSMCEHCPWSIVFFLLTTSFPSFGRMRIYGFWFYPYWYCPVLSVAIMLVRLVRNSPCLQLQSLQPVPNKNNMNSNCWKVWSHDISCTQSDWYHLKPPNHLTIKWYKPNLIQPNLIFLSNSEIGLQVTPFVWLGWSWMPFFNHC